MLRALPTAIAGAKGPRGNDCRGKGGIWVPKVPMACHGRPQVQRPHLGLELPRVGAQAALPSGRAPAGRGHDCKFLGCQIRRHDALRSPQLPRWVRYPGTIDGVGEPSRSSCGALANTRPERLFGARPRPLISPFTMSPIACTQLASFPALVHTRSGVRSLSAARSIALQPGRCPTLAAKAVPRPHLPSDALPLAAALAAAGIAAPAGAEEGLQQAVFGGAPAAEASAAAAAALESDPTDILFSVLFTIAGAAVSRAGRAP